MDLYKFIENYIEENGHSSKTMENIVLEFQDAMIDHNVGVYCEIKNDYNDYNELKVYNII